MKRRRLRVRDSFGQPAGTQPHDMIDLTGLHNANASMQGQIVIEEECSMGHWHEAIHLPLPCWGPDE